VDRYGQDAASHTPPIRKMLKMGIPVGAGTDATRVASYNPWVSLYWMVAGKTVGGTNLYPESNRLDRAEALRRYTVGSAWFSGEETKKGTIAPGQLADLAILTADYFSIPEEEIKGIESVLTIVDGKVTYAAGPFSKYQPSPIPILPEWSPVKAYGGYHQHEQKKFGGVSNSAANLCANALHTSVLTHMGTTYPFWGAGCDCFAF
jgi:Amidohydrolase family